MTPPRDDTSEIDDLKHNIEISAIEMCELHERLMALHDLCQSKHESLERLMSNLRRKLIERN